MGWARLDDGFHDHPKVDGLSLAAVGLYTLCLTWAHRHRRSAQTPGLIPSSRVERVGGKHAKKLAAELVLVGLWEAAEDGFAIHDFADYLPKERDPRERAEAGRKGAAHRWETANQEDGKPDGNLPSPVMATGMANDSSRASARPSPSRPDPTRTSGSEDFQSSPPLPANPPTKIEVLRVALETLYRKPYPIEAAQRTAELVLAGRGDVKDPVQYVLAAVKTDKRRFAPPEQTQPAPVPAQREPTDDEYAARARAAAEARAALAKARASA